jgi:hypothetical protein
LNERDLNHGVILVPEAERSRWLAQLLAPSSVIYVVDLDERAQEGIPDQRKGVEIRKIVGALENSDVLLPSADGILMANTLHFIQEQQVFLRSLLSWQIAF